MNKLKKYVGGVYHHAGDLTSSYARNVVSITPNRLYPRKDFQDRESMDPTPTEYSKSGTDSSVAEGKNAFDPAVTKPEQMREIAGQGIEGNPLEVSPANTELSKSTERTEGEKQRSEKIPHTQIHSGWVKPPEEKIENLHMKTGTPNEKNAFDIDPCCATASLFLFAKGACIICVHHDTLAIEQTFSNHTEDIQLLAVDTTSEQGAGKWVASYDADQIAIIWNCLKGDELIRFKSDQHLTTVTWMQNGTVAFGNTQGIVILLKPVEAKFVSIPTIDQTPITALAPTSDCKTFAIGYNDGTLLIANLEPKFTIKYNISLSGLSSQLSTLAWHSSSSRQKSDMLASQYQNGDLRVWSIAKSDHPCNNEAKVIRVLKRSDNNHAGYNWLGWSRNGRIVQFSEREIWSWDVRTKNVTHEVVPTLDNVRGLAVYGAGATLFTLGDDETIQQFDLNSPSQLVKNVQLPANILQLSHLPIFQGLQNNIVQSDSLNTTPERFDIQSNQPSQIIPVRPESSQSQKSMTSQDSMSQQNRKFNMGSDTSFESRSETNMIHTDSPWLSSQAPSLGSGRDSPSLRSNNSQSETSESLPSIKYHLDSQKFLDDNIQLKVYELFPFTKDRLDRKLGNINTNTMEISYFSNQNWCRRMFHILFDWNGESRGLINDEMRRHSPQSTTRILLGRWLGEVDLDNMTSYSGSMTQSDWMSLALNEIGKQKSVTRLTQVYVQRLLDCGDLHTAATIMISMGDLNDAIQVYSHYEKYLEAIILTCLVFPTDKSRQIQLIQKWGEWAVNCNQDQLASLCHALVDSKSSGSWCSSILLNARLGQGSSNNHNVHEILSPPLSPPDTHRPRRNIALTSALKLNTSFQNQCEGQYHYSKFNEHIVTPICSALSPVTGETAQTAFFQPGLNSVYQTPVSALTATPKSFKKQYFPTTNDKSAEELCSYEKKQGPQNESTPTVEYDQENLVITGSESNTSSQANLYTESPLIERVTMKSPMIQKKNDDVTISFHPFVSPLTSSFFASKYEAQYRNSSFQQNKPVDLKIQWPPLDSIITGDYMASPKFSIASYHHQTSNISLSPTLFSNILDPLKTKINHESYNFSKGISRNLDDYISNLESFQNENMPQSSACNEEKHNIYESPKNQSSSETQDLELLSLAPQLPQKDPHYDDFSKYNDVNQNNTLVSTEIFSHKKDRKLSRRVASCDHFPLFNPDDSLTTTEIERGRSQDRECSKMRVPSTPTWPTQNIFHGEDESGDYLRQYRKNLKSFDICNHGLTHLHGFISQDPRNAFEGSPNNKKGKLTQLSPDQQQPNCRTNKSPIRYFQRELHHYRSVSDVRLCDQKTIRDEVILKRKKAARELEERRKSLAQRPSVPTIIHPEELDRLSPLPQLNNISKVSSEIDSSELHRSQSNQTCISTTITKAQPNCYENNKEMTMKKSLGVQLGLPATPKALKNLISDTHSKSLSHAQLRNVGRYETPTKQISKGKANFFSHHLEKFQKLAPLPKTTYKPSKATITTPTRRMPPRSASAPILQEPPTSPLALPSDLPTHPAFQVELPPSSYKRSTDEKKKNNSAPLWYIRKVSPGKSKPGTLGYQTQYIQLLQSRGIAGVMNGIDEVIESAPPPSPPAPPLLKELQHLAGPHPPPPPPPPLPPPPTCNLERPNTDSVVSAISSGSGIIEIIRDDFYDDPFLHNEEMKDNSHFFTSTTSPMSTRSKNFSQTCDYRPDINQVHSSHQNENSCNTSSFFTDGYNRTVNRSPNNNISHASNSKITWVPSSSPPPRRSATASPPNYLAGNRSRYFLPNNQNHRHNGHRRCYTNDTGVL